MKREAQGGRASSVVWGLSGRGLKLALCAGVSALTVASLAFANPQGGEVVQGSATISTPNSTTTQIDQTSDKAIVNWKSFNINPDEATVFNQPGSTSVTLNRIFDQDPSIIAGLLTANGRLILINANGMVFENGASVNTAGLIATTADIGNDDFMAGNYRFESPGAANASIENKGLITAEQGGVVAFVAPSVKNSGVITAKLGRVALGAGNTFVLDLYGDNLISFPISAEIAQQLVGPDGTPLANLIDVSGKIEAGSVQLTARAARGLIDNVINVDGEIIASGVKQSTGATFLTGGTFDPVGGPAFVDMDKVAGIGGTQGSYGGAPGTYGGRIVIDGGANGVNVSGSLSASGTQGGSVSITGHNVAAGGSIAANGTTGTGGSISIDAENFAALTGSISAIGASGGSVNVSASNLLTAGAIAADGTNGAGGTVSLSAQTRQIATAATQVSARGTTGGGSINISGGSGEGAGLFTSGSYNATSTAGSGGSVAVGGRDIKMIDAQVDVSGATGGGSIAIGFAGSGSSRAISADNILVSPTSTFKADATDSGNGGSVVFWSNLATDFMGTLTARGGSLAGDGGFLEVSSKGDVGFWGLGDASAANGAAGLLTLDPKNINVSTAGGGMPSYELVDPGSGSTQFGTHVAVLANGNTVVTSMNDDTVQSNSGAVMVYNTTTGALISMITGSRADDSVGSGGITVLSTGNFVVASPNWDNGVANGTAGAVIFGNGTTGVSGVVSAANSLVGTTANNNVGNGGVVALANGNYVVISSNWDNGATTNVGAVTWGNGATGTVGAVTSGNSLIGSSANDNLGSGGVRALTNGNYVVASPNYDGGFTDRGAATWGNGATGIAGTISAANSYLGEGSGDLVGSGGIVALSNGNYVVVSPSWDGAGSDRGAVTWGNGATGSSGNVSTGNSLFGSTDADLVGNGGVTALTNGNYVVASLNWDANGGAANDDHGAVTWRSGAAASGTAVSAANSLVGASDNDNLGSGGVRALTNGNYVVASPNYDGGFTDRGAATWGNGATGALVGTISAANSYLGEGSGDLVGSGGIVALSNGNYVVVSPSWDGAGSDRGAVTWGNGTTGSSGNVSTANSLFGSTDSDLVGNGGVVALTNGNYVVASINWDANGGAANDDHGAVTWRNGAAASGTAVSAANSLVGSNDNDNVGSAGVRALTNGNFAFASPNWNNGGTTDVGAATWGNGTTGMFSTGAFGAVSATNSLIGANSGDQAGSAGIVALANGNYVVSTPFWNNGGDTDTGALTLGLGTGGTVGTITTANSMFGTGDDTELVYAGTGLNGEILGRSTTANGMVLVGLTDPNQITFARAQALTLTVHPDFLTRTLNTGTAVTLQASNDLTISSNIIANNGAGNGGALTLQAGRSVLINADITTDNGNLTIIANELLANGVINAQRDAGNAVITMASGTDIVAGSGNVVLRIASGAGKTDLASGDMTLRNVSGATILAENLGTTAGSDIILASGGGAVGLNATGTGTPLVLASQVGNFINQIGAGALQAANGRWIVYSQTPTANTIGGLAGTPYYNTPYNPANPTGLAATGNRFAYTIAPVLTVSAGNQTREYGEPNSVLTFNVTGLIGGDSLAGAAQGAPVLDTTATQQSAAGSGPHPITVTSLGTLSSDYNYGFTIGSGGLLTITPAQLFYLADPKSREYGDPNGALGGVIMGLKNGESLEDITDGTVAFTTLADNFSSPGSYAINGSGLTVTNSNYVATVIQDAGNATALTIVPAQLFYKATGFIREYGDANPDITGEIIGFKNSDTLGTVTEGEAEWSSDVEQSSDVGTYAIVGSNLLPTSPNYMPTIIQDPGNATAATITPAQLFYIAFAESREYGEANPDFDGELVGLKLNHEFEDVVTGTLEFITSAGATANAGLHEIDGAGLTVINPNYHLTIQQDAANATALEITPAQLTFVADFVTREYGDPNLLTGTVVGLKNGEAIESVSSGVLTWTSSATSTSGVGIYAVAGGGITLTTGNYFSVINQDPNNEFALEITPAQLFYLADPKSKTYGQLNPVMTGTLQGLKNGEDLEDVTDGVLVWTADGQDDSDAGIYGIFGSGLTPANSNYFVDILQAPSNESAFVINPAQLIYVADPKSRVFSFPDPAFTGTVLGLTNGDQLEDVASGDLVFTSTATPASPGGLYPINGGGLTVETGNYISTILQDPGNATAFEIIPIPLTTLQVQDESANSNESAVEQEQNTMSSRSNELNIVGVGPVSIDMEDGKNDELVDQLCVLGAPDAATSPGCDARQQGK